jgi:hypothetical protein
MKICIKRLLLIMGDAREYVKLKSGRITRKSIVKGGNYVKTTEGRN